MKTNTLFQVRFKPSVKPPRGFTKSAHYNVLSYDWHNHKYLIGNTWLHASNFIKIKVEDAPVFQKPVLRKIASLKPDEVIECNTDAELKSVLEQAEREGLVWFNKKKPTEHIPTDPTPLYVYTTNDKRLAYFAKKLSSFTPLPASKFVEVEAEGQEETVSSKFIMTGTNGDTYINGVKIDPPAPELKPFPKGYVIPEGTRVVALTNGFYSEKTCREGDVGTVVSERSVGGGYVDFDGRAKGGWAMRYKELAPLDDRDHPEHPEFNGKKKQAEQKSYCEQVTITQAQKDECRKIDDEILKNPFSNQGKLVDRNTQLQERVKELEEQLHQQQIADVLVSNDISAYKDEIRQLTKRYERIVSICNDAQYNANADLMYITLRSIANGEI